MDIKLFVCCFNPVKVPQHPLLIPVQTGAALARQRFSAMLHDDIGENISAKNDSYNELTAQYWAWKNVEADYYGFFHYRRYLYPDLHAKRPYILQKELILSDLGYDNFADLIEQYDLIMPIGENMHVSVRENYANSRFQHARDLQLAKNILLERSPEMKAAVKEYLSETICYFGNICIMRRDVFFDYCMWLFPILEEFDRRADVTGYSAPEQRVNGYLAERLLGIYYTHRKAGLRTLELPRVLFGPDLAALTKRLQYWMLPPGTRRRAWVKHLLLESERR